MAYVDEYKDHGKHIHHVFHKAGIGIRKISRALNLFSQVKLGTVWASVSTRSYIPVNT